ncbi:prepilin-type N-terminal cleavage/methylation domain-containing protein [Candidatus Entotheonella palauensis]|uniref:Type II secretion system protein J n=1 Tax=Candidatus Entotheonella gemina TaxID=1429439 RepID=W4M1V0_9BACT|nr:prepilin-type N-terminal cleavage/methylation domain-containing protein [Candidatus Entotheonella palauensis]ETX04294.1 MAG: hypothetical protein ETSY2_29590 [Candidatus Entotheonella gemina]
MPYNNFNHFHRVPMIAVPGHWQQRGFTLIELLLALLMFSIVTTAVFATFSAIANGVQSGRSRIDRLHVSLAARQQILKEIRSAYRMDDTKCQLSRSLPKEERPAYICKPLQGDDDTGPDGLPLDRIVFLTIPYQILPSQQPKSELCQVCYFIDKNDFGRFALFRYENCTLGGEGESDLRCGGPDESLELTDAIVGMNFAYYDAEEQAKEAWPWQNSNPDKPLLPCRIHLSLFLRDAPDEVVESTVTLPMQNVCEAP